MRPGSAVGPFVAALTEAGPEAAEHLVNAAHELTLAVKVVVDAFERTLAEQRAHASWPSVPRRGRSRSHVPTLGTTAEPRAKASRVQNIDLE